MNQYKESVQWTHTMKNTMSAWANAHMNPWTNEPLWTHIHSIHHVLLFVVVACVFVVCSFLFVDVFVVCLSCVCCVFVVVCLLLVVVACFCLLVVCLFVCLFVVCLLLFVCCCLFVVCLCAVCLWFCTHQYTSPLLGSLMVTELGGSWAQYTLWFQIPLLLRFLCWDNLCLRGCIQKKSKAKQNKAKQSKASKESIASKTSKARRAHRRR